MRINSVIGMLAVATFIAFANVLVWEALLCLTSGIGLFFYKEYKKGKELRRKLEEDMSQLQDILKATNVNMGQGSQTVLMLDPEKISSTKPIVNFVKLPSTKYDLIP